jgi:hypothetical protein
VALLIQRGSLLAGVAATVVGAALLTGAIVLSRAQRDAEAAVAVAWMASVYAAVAGLMLVTEDPFFGPPVAAGGGGAMVVGFACLVGLGEGRALVIPPVVVGAIFLATGLVMSAAEFDAAVVLTTALVLVVTAGSLLPWLALGATGTSVDQLYSAADITAEPRPIDADRVGADARLAHEILVAVSATVGLLLVLIAPLAVSLGVAGAELAVLCCLVVMLRTRQYRTRSEVLVGLVSGILGLASVGVATLWLHPDWRPAAAVVLAASGAVLLAASMLPATPSVRRGRLGDVAESVALLALLPLLVVADGVFSAIRGCRSKVGRWPPRRTSSRPTPSAAAGWSPRSSPARPAGARSSPRDPAAPSSAAWRSPCCSRPAPRSPGCSRPARRTTGTSPGC